jgi:uncharacterized protein
VSPDPRTSAGAPTGGAGPALRLAAIDWGAIGSDLDAHGCARLPVILDPVECAAVVALWDDAALFRKQVNMERLRFGAGEYRYFAAPLPPVIQALREAAYPPLAAVANRWRKTLGETTRYPASLEPFLRLCHRRGQVKPTPLLLRYDAGGYNRMHQDLYGQVAFPLQMTFLLSRPGADFTGGENLFVEQRPREQSIGTAVALSQGEAVVFATSVRPIRGARGWRRATLRHGVSRIVSGTRLTLGLIFHDAG